MHSNCLLKAALRQRSLPPFSANRENEQFVLRETSPNDSSSAAATIAAPPPVKRFCTCAPTNHPGSFRCRFHRSRQRQWAGRPLSSGIKPMPRPSSSEGVLLSGGGGGGGGGGVAVLPPKKLFPARSSVSAHETTRPSRLRRMEVAASVSSNSETSVSRCSTPDLDATVEKRIKDDGNATRPVSDAVEITSNIAVLEDDYKCALRVIQISQTASEFATDRNQIEVVDL